MLFYNFKRIEDNSTGKIRLYKNVILESGSKIFPAEFCASLAKV